METIVAFENEDLLLESVQLCLGFLKHLEREGIFCLDRPSLHMAMYRYSKLWLPFLGKISKDAGTDLDFAPPLDVHWIWYYT